MGEMTADQLKKYNEQNPPQKPKHGRFSPDRQFFLCSTPEEVEKLEAAGWNTNPFEHDDPYKPEDVIERKGWGDIVFPKADTDVDGKIDKPLAKGKKK